MISFDVTLLQCFTSYRSMMDCRCHWQWRPAGANARRVGVPGAAGPTTGTRPSESITASTTNRVARYQLVLIAVVDSVNNFDFNSAHWQALDTTSILEDY